VTLADEIAAVSSVAAAISSVAAVIAIVYAARSVTASRRATQLQVFDGIFKEIKKLDAEYRTCHSEGGNALKGWCYEFFNTIEYMAFLLNNKLILQREMQDFYKDAVRHWYETFVGNATRKDLDDPSFFPEFKRLHRKLKDNHLI
jgi:hypothetical protein